MPSQSAGMSAIELRPPCLPTCCTACSSSSLIAQPCHACPAIRAGGGPLSIEAAIAAGPAQSEVAPPPIEPAPTDLRAAEEDPLAALAAAVEADKPK